MKTEHTKQNRDHRPRGFTLVELLVVIAIIGVLAAIAFPGLSAAMRRAKMTAQLANGQSIYKAMAAYAVDPSRDEFPAYKDPDDPNTLVTNSNEAFEILLKGSYLDDKQVLNNPASAWCKKTSSTPETAKRVQVGENDWSYVVGLRWSSKDSRWPILANAFSPGTTTYGTDPNQKGGVWKGTQAIVIYAGGNGAVVDTKEQGTSYFVKRPDKPQADAFQKDDAWLAGDHVKVLYPAE